MVAAAVVGAGVASTVGGAISSSASSKAGSAQASADEATAAAQRQQGQDASGVALNTGQDAVNLLNPYAQQGNQALSSLNANMNYLTTPYQPTQAQLSATPGYQFAMQQGLQSTQNAAAAQGLGVSGSALKSAAAYSTGLAQQTYAQDAGIYQTNQAQIGNLLTGLVDNGQNASTAQAQIYSQAGATAAQALTGTSTASANSALTGAAAQAAGTVGSANALSSGISSAGSSLSQSAILNSLLGQNGAGTTTGAETPLG